MLFNMSDSFVHRQKNGQGSVLAVLSLLTLCVSVGFMYEHMALCLCCPCAPLVCPHCFPLPCPFV